MSRSTYYAQNNAWFFPMPFLGVTQCSTLEQGVKRQPRMCERHLMMSQEL